MPAAKAEHLPLKSYTVADGLPSNVINKIVRDSRGFLWFCTAEGLSLFDGYRFINYGSDEGLPHPNVTDLLETHAGDYWVATSLGLCKFNPKGLPGRQVPVSHASPSRSASPMFTVFMPDGDDPYMRSITTLLEARDGTIWCGTWRGLFRVLETDGRVTLVAVGIGLPTDYPMSGLINALVEDRHDSLWIGAATGVYRRWPDGSAARYTTKDGLPDTNVHELLEDHLGNLWVGTRFGGMFRLAIDGGHQPPIVTGSYNRKNGLMTDWVFDLHESSDGKLWAATNFGLVEFPIDNQEQTGPLHVYTRNNGFIYHEIVSVTGDSDGNLWLGTINGAMKFAHNGFFTFGEQDGIKSVFSVFQSSNNDLYAYGFVVGDKTPSPLNATKRTPGGSGSYEFMLGRFDGERFAWVFPNALRDEPLSWSDKPFVVLLRTGEWWIDRFMLPSVQAFSELKTARPIFVYPQRGPETVAYSVFEDSGSNLWISTTDSVGNGLARWERATSSIRDMAGTPGLPSLKEILPLSFEEDRAGNTWVGFSNDAGVARYSNKFEFFNTQSGLPPGSINDLYLDGLGRLWIASSRGGVARVDDLTVAAPTFVSYSTANGLSSNYVTAITEDSQGRIYVGTSRGIDRISPVTGRIKHFTTADGLSPGRIVAAHRDDKGALWFATTEGLSRFVPEPDRLSAPPPIVINGLQLAGQKQSVSALGETEIVLPDLAANRNQLQIEFAGLSLAPGETLLYQHMLEGADVGWSAPTNQRSVNYASLSPGRYRFLVRAVNSDGTSSPRSASITFTILPPFWMRWWFGSLTIVLITLVMWVLYRYRMRRILEVTKMRERIATDLHDDIGANLTKITLLSEVVRQQLGNNSEIATTQISKPLSAIARISRESVSAMSDIVWAINPQRDSFRDLVRRMRPHAEEIFTLRGIELVFNAPDDVPNLRLGADVRRDLFLFFKEAVNNAARHSQCTRVEIHLRAESAWISLTISDNGIGFDPSIEGHGQGLIGMRNRARSVGGSVEIESRSVSGTIVRVRIPATAVRIPTRMHR